MSRTSFRRLAAYAITLPLLVAASDSAIAQTDKAALLEARIEAAATALKDEKRLSHLSDAHRRGITRFVAGNMLFVLLHEFGHTLISEMGLPVLGREEDAADAFASVAMLSLKSEFSERVLTEAARGWFLSDRRDQKENVLLAYYDEHSLSRQRAYQIVCHMVGSDAEKFGALADEARMPPERQESCQGDFSNASWSWDTALKPYKRTSQPRTTITVRYEDGGEPFRVIARAMQSIEMLEIVAERFSDMFAWRAPFTMEAKACGRPHAEWNLARRTLTVCYELAQEFALLYEGYGSGALVSER
jgi:hypothetical protein